MINYSLKPCLLAENLLMILTTIRENSWVREGSVEYEN